MNHWQVLAQYQKNVTLHIHATNHCPTQYFDCKTEKGSANLSIVCTEEPWEASLSLHPEEVNRRVWCSQLGWVKLGLNPGTCQNDPKKPKIVETTIFGKLLGRPPSKMVRTIGHSPHSEKEPKTPKFFPRIPPPEPWTKTAGVFPARVLYDNCFDDQKVLEYQPSPDFPVITLPLLQPASSGRGNQFSSKKKKPKT